MMFSMEKRYNLAILEALFKDQLYAENCSKVTIKNYLSDLRHYLEWFCWHQSVQNLETEVNLDVFIQQVHSQCVTNYFAYLTENMSPVATIKRRASTMRRFYSFCHCRGLFIEEHEENTSVSHALSNVCSKHEPETTHDLTIDQQFEIDLKDELDMNELSVCQDILREVVNY